MPMKNSSDTIGNQTRDLPACNAVPQPTAPPGVPFNIKYVTKMVSWFCQNWGTGQKRTCGPTGVRGQPTEKHCSRLFARFLIR